ncbi:hypothetical protein PYW07_005047 [Mythimna separata]|uniref:Glyceraldehyde 3-phosphate dehydrogenase NAD(P) binding domain-containing protein n=1 Tax=Mythimna separata TaxID=271217 RepID=A0AAD8DND4_MYTSE|nr:hypothetical protein PYW07_005047 [Mythimna separata]
MVIKVGINGFGRIGRVIFRTCLQNPDIELSAINDPAIDIEYICYLIKFDSTHGKFQGSITHTENEVNIDGRLIKVFRDKLPHTVPWQVAGVQYVIEASGMFTCLDKSSGHLASDGVKRVIVTAPSADIPMIILGVNDNKLNAEQKVLSCASSTLYCLAPIVKVLEDNYGVTEGFITSIHAMTPSLKPLDGLCLRGKQHWRDHRSILQNIIPASTGSCKALARIIPQVKDKMAGLAFRVPIVNVSVLDMTVRLDTNTTLQHIVKAVEEAGRTFLQNIIKISNEEAVSSDFSRDSHSCILDADSSLELKPNFYKIICWYENEYSYACRVLDSIFFSERQFNKPVRLPCKMTYVRAKLSKKQDEVQQTERSSKDVATIECSAELPKFCTSAQETACKRKPIARPVIFRKPLPSFGTANSAPTPAVNRDTKKGNELFKIWNDNNDAQKTAARQNRSSFFHSCMAFGPKPTDNAEDFTSQDTLETVKREFSKMVHITEDLLKKSNANTLQLGAAMKSSLEGVKSGSSGASMESETKIANLNNPPANNSVFGICGDYKMLLPTPVDRSKEEVLCRSCTQRNDNNSDNIITNAAKKVVSSKPMLIPSREIVESFTKQNSVMDLCQKAIAQNLAFKANDSLKKVNSKIYTNVGSKGQMNKIDNNVMDGLSKETIVQCVVKVQKEITPSISNNATKDCVEEKQEVNISESSRSPQVPAEKKVRINPKAYPAVEKPYKDIDKFLNKKDYNIRIIDEELQKRNIVIVNNEKQNIAEASSESCDVSSDKSNVEADTSRKTLNKKILESSCKKVCGPVVLVPEERARCGSPGTAGCARIKPDLYDKLDSTSATDSTNSFEINERKSQVIQICDLTNSLEDLSRLDKICRIIEISDELSDKLFSSLDREELTGLHQKQWSFRDLCERIQLDDFCNKVFGKTKS